MTFEQRINDFDQEFLRSLRIEAPPVQSAGTTDDRREDSRVWIICYSENDLAQVSRRYPMLSAQVKTVFHPRDLNAIPVGNRVYVTPMARALVCWPSLEWMARQRQLEVVWL